MECNQEVCSSWLQRRPDTFICQGRSHKWCRASLTDESIWSKAQPRGISRSLPRRKTGLASNTKKSYIKSKSHCLIFYQSIVGGLYTIISEGKFTQSLWNKVLTEVVGCGKLYIALSKKPSRVSTLTAAQMSDWWSDIDKKNFCWKFVYLSGGYDIHSFFCVSHRKPEGIHLTEVYDN